MPAPTLEGIASVMSVIRPGKKSHKVVAMASNRTLRAEQHRGRRDHAIAAVLTGRRRRGLDLQDLHDGAAAMQMGMGIKATLDVPGRFSRPRAWGNGGAKRLPQGQTGA